MTEHYSLSDGIFSARTLEDLKAGIAEFLSRKGIAAAISVCRDSVKVDYHSEENIDADEDERIVIGFCQAGRFGKARRVVRDLIEKRPWDANARRLQAQIFMMEGKIDDALISCHESLCLAPRNEYALVLMGNLLARDRNRFADALKYYRKALDVNPDSALTLTNYAALRLDAKTADLDETECLLKRSLELDPHLLTTYHALVHVYIQKECPLSAFEVAQQGLKKGITRAENREPIRELLLSTVVRLAPSLSPKGISEDVLNGMKAYGDKYGTPIRLEARDDLDVPLRMELAQNHLRDEHVIAYSPLKAGVSLNHLLCMTLEKAEMHQAAKRIGRAKRIVNAEEHYRRFVEQTRFHLNEGFRRMAAGREDAVLRFLHHGLIEQLANCVPDALAEYNIFNRMPKLRPAQLISVVELAKGIVQSARVAESGDIPRNVVRATRTIGLFTLHVYRDVVGIDMRGDVNAPADEMRLASGFFSAFRKLVDDYSPGDEWGMIASMAEALHLDPFFEILPDDDQADLADAARKAKAKLEARDTAGIDASNEAFCSDLKNSPAIGMSVMFFMVDAIKSLRAMSQTEVQKIAFQIATMGISGIQPGRKSGYGIPALPGKDMSGCQALAWYYASWRMAFPEKMDSLESSMPFADQYLRALQMLAAQGDQ